MQMWTLSVINWFRWSFEQSRQRSTCRCEFSLKSRVCDIAPEGNTLILEIPKFPQNVVYDTLREAAVPKISFIPSAIWIELMQTCDGHTNACLLHCH